MNLFATGFPGFIARTLIPALTLGHPYDRIILLVEQRFSETAKVAARRLLADANVTIVAGDISAEGLGFTDPDVWKALLEEESEWWHLAAIYRLEVGRELARRVNVDGTRNILKAAAKARRLSRLNYVSTAYVSGLTKGVVREDDLPEARPENFKNFYEYTKNEAEWLVRAEMSKIPTTIYRFGIVTGDSKTGATEKFDGPFFTIKYYDRFGHLPLPMIGDGQATMNMVPVDYVVDATVAISRKPETVGKCFQIVDPHPITTRELFERVARELGGKPPAWKIPPSIMDRLMKIRSVRRKVAIPREAMIYINYPVTYDSTNTAQALQGTGITCPPARDYIGRLVEFYKKNRHREELHQVIE